MGKGLLERLGLARKPPLRLEAFRERVIAGMLQRIPDLQIERVGEAEILYGDGGQTHVARGYAYYREHPKELDIIIRQLADHVTREDHRASPDELIVLVRPRTFRAGEEGSSDRGLAYPFPAGLIAVVAIDLPDRYDFPTAQNLRDELGMDDDAIWDRAFANLIERVGLTPPKCKPGCLVGLKTDIGLASSLLVLEEYWSHPNLSGLGDLVVAPVERDELVLAPANDPQMVRALRNLVAQRDSSQFLCDRLLIRRNGAWEEFGE
jgi:hypothetical protein